MKRYKGSCENFFGVEHRMRKEEMEAVQQRSEARMKIRSRRSNAHR